MREMGWVLGRRMRAATYTTFVRRSGAIRAGLGVAVNHDPKSNTLNAYVTEYNQSVLGATTSAKTALRRHLRGRRSVKVFGKQGQELGSRAFWWRFLEFGTGPRRAIAKPKFLRKGKAARSTRQARAQSRWEQSRSVGGGIRARAWLAPAFSASAGDSIDKFREVFLK